MNLFLLHLFVRAARDRLAGATLGTPSWYRPVLVVPFSPAAQSGTTRYLVAVLETPGPFVYITADRPLEGARGSAAALVEIGGRGMPFANRRPPCPCVQRSESELWRRSS